MSGEDDTFDIDLYGNEDEQQDLYGQDANGNGGGWDQEGVNTQNQTESGVAGANEDEIDWDDPPTKQNPDINNSLAQQPEPPKQGTKRKASFDDEEQQSQQPHHATISATWTVDPNATAALKLTELNWWTTEEDLRGFCAKAGTEADLRDLSFGEHKINGKAKGEAYLEFASPAAANKAKNEIERQARGEGEGAKKLPYKVWFSGLGNPFRNVKDAGGAVGAARKDFGAQQGGARGGAYNNFNNRGNFGGRGNFSQNRGGGGGGGYGNNQFQNRMGGQQQQQGGWGMNGNFGGGGGGGGYGMGGFGNMQGMYNPAMMMQNMQGMMGQGGFGGGMGMGGMGNMGGMRGGGNMMGRGGWGGGSGGGGMMGNGYGGGGGGGFGQGQQNKRPKME